MGGQNYKLCAERCVAEATFYGMTCDKGECRISSQVNTFRPCTCSPISLWKQWDKAQKHTIGLSYIGDVQPGHTSKLGLSRRDKDTDHPRSLLNHTQFELAKLLIKLTRWHRHCLSAKAFSAQHGHPLFGRTR